MWFIKRCARINGIVGWGVFCKLENGEIYITNFHSKYLTVKSAFIGVRGSPIREVVGNYPLINGDNPAFRFLERNGR